METRESERRCTGTMQEYPGSTVWKDYVYLCPVCGKWSEPSNVTQLNDDGTESYLCEPCGEEAFPLAVS